MTYQRQDRCRRLAVACAVSMALATGAALVAVNVPGAASAATTTTLPMVATTTTATTTTATTTTATTVRTTTTTPSTTTTTTGHDERGWFQLFRFGDGEHLVAVRLGSQHQRPVQRC